MQAVTPVSNALTSHLPGARIGASAAGATATGDHLSPQQLAEAYLSALGRAGLTAMLGLFSDGALVHSPLHGPRPAGDFFPALFSDTAESRLTLRGVTQGGTADGIPLLSFWFRFDWQLRSGTRSPFDVADVLELAEGDRIAALHIVYDTVSVRPAGLRAGDGAAFLARGPA